MSKWALILGASTGHGGATAISLAEKGYGIIGFHFDRGETKKEAEITIRDNRMIIVNQKESEKRKTTKAALKGETVSLTVAHEVND